MRSLRCHRNFQFSEINTQDNERKELTIKVNEEYEGRYEGPSNSRQNIWSVIRRILAVILNFVVRCWLIMLWLSFTT